VRRGRGIIAIVSIAAAVATVAGLASKWPVLRAHYYAWQVRHAKFAEAEAAANRFATLGPEVGAVVPALVRARIQDGPEREMLIMSALSWIATKGGGSGDAVRSLLVHPDDRVRGLATWFYLDTAGLKVLKRNIGSTDPDVRFAAAQAIPDITFAADIYREAIDALITRLDDPAPRMSTLPGTRGPSTVGALAMQKLHELTGYTVRAEIVSWWASPEVRTRSNDDLVLDAFVRSAPAANPRVHPRVLKSDWWKRAAAEKQRRRESEKPQREAPEGQ
jgi:hypothetical protein